MAINERKAGTILAYANMFFNVIVGIIYTPIMLDLLGQSEYGLFGTASSLTAYLSLLSFGVSGAYFKHVMECRAKKDLEEEYNLNGMFLILYVFFSVLVVIVGSVLIFSTDNIFGNSLTSSELYSIKWIMFFTIVNYVITFLSTPVFTSIISNEKYFLSKIIALVTSVINPVINIVVLLYFPYAVSISVISVIIAFITDAFYFWYAYSKLGMRFRFKKLEFRKLKSILIFSSFLLLNEITNMITNSTDRLVLGAVSGTVAVAIYNVGTNFTNYFTTFSTSISGVFGPRINSIVAKSKIENKSPDNELNEIFVKVGRIQFLVLAVVVIGFATLGYPFIVLWVGEEYTYSYWVALLLMLSLLIPFIQNTGIHIQTAKNMHKARSIAYALVALANVIFTAIFASYFSSDQFPVGLGAVVAALVTFLCILFGQVIFMNFYYQQKVGVDVISFWKNILKMLPGMIIPTAFAFVFPKLWYPTSFKVLLVEAIAVLFVYVISVYFLSMNSYEKQLLKKPIKSIKNKLLKSKK